MAPKEWREANKEKIKEYNAQYRAMHKNELRAKREENKVHIYEKQKEWFDANKQYIKEYMKEYDKTHREKNRERVKKDRKLHPDRHKKYAAKFKTEEYYQISIGRRYKLNEIQTKQAFSITHCPICGREFTQGTSSKRIDGEKRKRTIDHNHATGEVRGVICHTCNVMLGHAQDNIDTLLNAIQYLKGELQNLKANYKI